MEGMRELILRHPYESHVRPSYFLLAVVEDNEKKKRLFLCQRSSDFTRFEKYVAAAW